MRNLMKRWAALIAAAVIAVSMMTGVVLTAAAADTVVEEGNCGASGSNVKYRITRKDSGVYHMEISGKGFMADYGSGTDNGAPWSKSSYADSVKSVTVTKGVLSVGAFSFYNMKNLDTAVLAEGIEKIGQYAFCYTGLTAIRLPSTVKTVDKCAFWETKITVLTLPASLQVVGYGAFSTPLELSNVYYPGSKDQYLKISFDGGNKGMNMTSDSYLNQIHYNSTDPNYGNEGDTNPTFNQDGGTSSSGTFADVPDGIYYKEAVDWAVAQKITTGTDATHFSPNTVCTRGQAVTFLYRAAGEPAVSGTSPFNDVTGSSSFYKAVIWAAQKKITTGKTATVFGVNDPCTRAQIVTFLWRAAGEPSASASMQFSDVNSSSYCYKAVRWALEKGITNGTDKTHFSPDKQCTRAEIVTMLHRGK